MVTIYAPPNKIERIDQIWAVVSTDATGEGICGMPIGETMFAMVTSDERILQQVMMPMAHVISNNTGNKLRVLKFTTREEINEILPEGSGRG